MATLVHEQTEIWVKVYVDNELVDMVNHLNSFEGVQTHGSCRGTIGEGGAYEFGPFVNVSWASPEALKLISGHYDMSDVYEAHAHAHPRGSYQPSVVNGWSKERVDA